MKKYKLVAIVIAVVCLITVLSGCSPKHNELATVDAVKTITQSFTREQVKDLLGEPLAYYAEEKDWEKHGYDILVYSPDDIQILDWYKGRSSVVDNLPGFVSLMHWSNGTWDRKHYTGVAKTDIAQMSYIYMSITFVDSIITKINCLQYTQGKSGSMPIYSVTYIPDVPEEEVA